MASYPENASMTDRKPDRGYNITREFSTATYATQAGYEKRRLRSRRAKRLFRLEYKNLSSSRKNSIVSFYNARNGTYEDFQLSLSHLNEAGGSINVRFNGPLNITHVISGNTTSSDIFNVSFEVVEVFG